MPLASVQKVRTQSNPVKISRTQTPEPSSLFPGLYFFSDMVPFLAFSTTSDRWGTAQEGQARGLARFSANRAKTCIFVFWDRLSLVTRRLVAGSLVTGGEEVGRWWRERLSLVTRRWRLAKLCSKVRISAASTFKSCFPLPPKSMLGSLFGAEKKSPKHPKFTVLYTSYPCFVWILEHKNVQSCAWSSEQKSSF